MLTSFREARAKTRVFKLCELMMLGLRSSYAEWNQGSKTAGLMELRTPPNKRGRESGGSGANLVPRLPGGD